MPMTIKCDICDEQLFQEFYDARIPHLGVWAALCPLCFKQQGCKLGLGRGMHFVKQGNQFVKKT